MSNFDFGNLADVLQSAAMANANRSTSPISGGVRPATESVVGSTVAAVLMTQAYLGSSTDFVWGVDAWDDGIHTVA